MVKRKRTPPSPLQKASLILPRTQVEETLKERIKRGHDIQSVEIRTESDLEEARSRQSKWHEYNVDYLKRCFSSDIIADQYARASRRRPVDIDPSIDQLINSFKGRISDQITELESILERLELIPDAVPTAAATAPTSETLSKAVFIVHGHDEAAKTNVARFIEKLGLEVIILHEQANKGQTIIEKFEAHAATAGFAVVLLTADDVGASKDKRGDLRARARQNVILELGYFSGALGRNKVCVLYKDDIEIPSDYVGVVYTPLDDAGGWHLKLAKEIKAAGLDVDLNKAL